MFSADKIAPASFRRAFFFCCLACAALAGRAAVPVARPPDLAQIGLPDAAEAKRILGEFRQSGIPGRYFLEFELHHLPRRGAETVFRGRYWGGRNEQGAISRIELTDGAGKVTRLLLQNGEQPALWRSAGGPPQQLGLAAAFEPLIAGLEVTAFDLQMPFLYWPNARLDRIDRVRGRPAHAFVFPAPSEVGAQRAGIVAVRAFLDTQYNALVQVEYHGAKGLLKTISLVDLKKIGEQWIPKSLDVRNDVTRDKTRFLVTGAALNLELPAAVFTPAALADAIPAPAAVVRVEP